VVGIKLFVDNVVVETLIILTFISLFCEFLEMIVVDLVVFVITVDW
jgi:hypothetical protein